MTSKLLKSSEFLFIVVLFYLLFAVGGALHAHCATTASQTTGVPSSAK